MARLMTIGVPFDPRAAEAAVDEASLELRKLGLVDRLAMSHDLKDWGELAVPDPGPAPGPGLFDENSLHVMTARLRDAVSFACAEDYVPIVYAADCAVLLGALAGARDVFGQVGLLFVGEHVGASEVDVSSDGHAAGRELVLALGAASETAPEPLRELLPLVRPERLAMLGPRNAGELRGRGFGAAAAEAAAVAAGRPSAADSAAARPAERRVYSRDFGRWWLHLDVGVVLSGSMPARALVAPGGLSWAELTELASSALKVRGCCGVSLVVCSPELDPERTAARATVEFVDRLAAQLR
jgi:arginase